MVSVPRYLPRMAFSGALKLLCPYCGHIGLYRIQWTSWRIRCRSEACNRTYALGHTLYPFNGRYAGRAALPPPDIAFPVVPTPDYIEGKPVHRLNVKMPRQTRRGKKKVGKGTVKDVTL